MATGIFTLRNQLQGLLTKAWTGTQKTNFVEYLVVAGGGGGGYTGGGGAGGVLTGIVSVTTGASYTVTIGPGGTGSTSGGDNATQGTASVFGSISAVGGGAGIGNYTASAAKNNGGSGGGGGIGNIQNGQGTAGQGNAGGLSSASTNAGGGGGAGTVGLNANTYSGNGGAGIASAISGTVTTYAGGGGGGASTNANSNVGSGGVGGGGSGSITNGTSGTANTGGGGGGSGYNGSSVGNGGSGGSGIVIISYPDTYNAPTTLTGTYTASTSGSGSLYYPDAGGSGSTAGQGYVEIANTTALTIGTTGTLELWVYPTRYTTNHRMFSIQGVPNAGYDFYYDTSGNVNFGYTSGGANGTVSGNPLPLNTWTHIAFVFNSGTATVFFNGVSQTLTGTTTGYNFTYSTTNLFIGSEQTAGQYSIIGYLSNARIVKGVAVYTGNFSAITKPLTAIQSAGTNISAITGTQTSLLMNTVSGSAYADSSTNSYYPVAVSTGSNAVIWNQSSPFATGLGYKNRVYTWTSSGTVTF